MLVTYEYNQDSVPYIGKGGNYNNRSPYKNFSWDRICKQLIE